MTKPWVAEDPEDIEQKATFGKLYDAIRVLAGDAAEESGIRPWEDLHPKVQFLFASMLSSPIEISAIAEALQMMFAFMFYMNSDMGHNTAEEVVD